MKLVLAAAAVLVAVVPGASATAVQELRLVDLGPAVISPNGNAVNDAVRLHVDARPNALLGLRAYAWGGRLVGWRRIRTGVSVRGTRLVWDGSTSTGRVVGDGSYLVTACYEDSGRLLAPEGVARPGAAEASVRRPPWRRSGCLANPRVIRVERLAAFVDSTGSFAPGARMPLVPSADNGEATTELRQDCHADASLLVAGQTVPRGAAPGLYHAIVTDATKDIFQAPVVVRARRPLHRPLPRTALVVWPYLTWRAYNAYDADLNGIPDSWYQFWRQRRVSLEGPLLPGGLEDDHKAAQPFSRWLCSRQVRTQHITDVELGRLPLSTVRRYRAVVFPGHTEYYERQTYDLLRRYREGGGNIVFLQANPFYREVRLDREQNAVVMTDYDAREGRSDFEIAGVGYDGCCFPRDRAEPYVAARGADYERVRWLFRGTGIGPGDLFGYAGSESDRIDPELTPRDHVVAARAIIRGKRGVIDAAMVWSRAGRGSSFATGNYTFLRMGRGLTFKLLDNVWRKLVG